VSVDERVCSPAIELHLSPEKLPASIFRPLFFRTILSHLENYSNPSKFPIRHSIDLEVVVFLTSRQIKEGNRKKVNLLNIVSLILIFEELIDYIYKEITNKPSKVYLPYFTGNLIIYQAS
jgi:hypothetical protein